MEGRTYKGEYVNVLVDGAGDLGCQSVGTLEKWIDTSLNHQ